MQCNSYSTSRRTFLIGGACMAAAANLRGGAMGRYGQEGTIICIINTEQRRTSHGNDHD